MASGSGRVSIHAEWLCPDMVMRTTMSAADPYICVMFEDQYPHENKCFTEASYREAVQHRRWLAAVRDMRLLFSLSSGMGQRHWTVTSHRLVYTLSFRKIGGWRWTNPPRLSPRTAQGLLPGIATTRCNRTSTADWSSGQDFKVHMELLCGMDKIK